MVPIWLILVSGGLINSLYFYLDAGAERCFIEDLPLDTIVSGISASFSSPGGLVVLPSLHRPYSLILSFLASTSCPGKYKGEEYDNEKHVYHINPQLGVQITVTVESFFLLHKFLYTVFQAEGDL